MKENMAWGLLIYGAAFVVTAIVLIVALALDIRV